MHTNIYIREIYDKQSFVLSSFHWPSCTNNLVICTTIFVLAYLYNDFYVKDQEPLYLMCVYMVQCRSDEVYETRGGYLVLGAGDKIERRCGRRAGSASVAPCEAMPAPRHPAALLPLPFLLLLLLLLGAAQASAGQHPAQLRRGQIDCRYDEDCIPNAYCKEQKYCLCKAGAFAYTLSNGSIACLKAASTVGDACSLDEQCVMNLSENSVCDGARGCQCRQNAHFVEGRCHRTSRAGESCRVSNDCHIDNPNVMLSCLYQVCVCPHQYRPVNNGSDCVRTLELGQNCDTDAECITEGAVCKDVCHCTVHHEISQDGRRCLLAAEVLGSPCQEDAQCAKYIEFAKCQSGVCVCEDGYHYTSAKNKCWRNIGLNERCSDSAECILTHGNHMTAICAISGRCQCMEGYEPTSDNSDCRSKANAAVYSTLLLISTTILFVPLR